MEFNDFKMKTSRVKDILNMLCKDMLKYVMFIDDEKKSKLILATKRNHCACVPCYWGAPTLFESHCHSHHHRYLELLKYIGKNTEFKFESLSELHLLLTLKGI